MSRLRRAAAVLSALVVAAGVLVLDPSSALAYPRPGSTTHISIGPDGSEGNQNCFDHDITAAGRYVIFTCSASNLVIGDANGKSDIFMRDVVAGTTEIVSLSTDGLQGNANSFHPSVSSDGRFIAFASDASNLVAGDTNQARDVFLRDVEAQTTSLVSVSGEEVQGNRVAELPSITPNGRFVAFQSEASNLVPNDTNGGGLWPADIFVRDLLEGTTELVSVASDGSQQNRRAHRPTISADGRYVAFQSLASNLVPTDTNDDWDVFVHDRVDNDTLRVSESSSGTEGDGKSLSASISANGRYVAFDSLATNLVPYDDNQDNGGTGNDDGSDIFVHDLATGTTERVSLDSAGAERPDGTSASGSQVQAEDQSSRPSISADGRFVVYENTHIEQAAGQPGLFLRIYDVHVHDRLLGATERVTVTTDGANPRGTASYMPAISADGRYVTFTTHANNIAPSARNNAIDVFMRDRGPTLGTFNLAATAEGDQVDLSGRARFAGSIVSTGTDGSGDTPTGAAEAGADLIRASVALRPEEEDLFVKWSVVDLPEPTAGAPGVVYGMRFQIDGITYEARALRVGISSVPPALPHFALYRCEPICVETHKLRGGVGSAGDDVRLAIPLEALSIAAPTTVTSIRAYTALGEAAIGEGAPLDELSLPAATLAMPAIDIGIAPAGTPQEDVTFDVETIPADGIFAATLDVSALGSGNYDLWARACLGGSCSSSSVPIVLGDGSVEPIPSALELSVDGVGIRRALRGRLFDPATQVGITNRVIDFYADGELIGSATTSEDGTASLDAPPRYRGASHDFEARFEGDTFYLASSDRAQT